MHLVVDATGERAAIATDLGLRGLRDERYASGWEYEMRNVDLQNAEGCNAVSIRA
jgi:flavin-dependent dehydrogenase